MKKVKEKIPAFQAQVLCSQFFFIKECPFSLGGELN